MSFVVGNIVRPGWAYLSLAKNGALVDWNGLASAQGRVTTVYASGGLSSAPYWEPSTSTAAVAGKTEARYGVKIWDIAAQAFATVIYPESELAIGSVAGANLAGTWDDPATDARAANLVRTR